MTTNAPSPSQRPTPNGGAQIGPRTDDPNAGGQPGQKPAAGTEPGEASGPGDPDVGSNYGGLRDNRGRSSAPRDDGYTSSAEPGDPSPTEPSGPGASSDRQELNDADEVKRRS